MPKLVDSHCHLNFDPLNADTPAVLARARAAGVDFMLCVAVTLERFPEILALANRHPFIYASVGVHPNEREGREPTVDEIVDLAEPDPVVAIGETGLDYFRTPADGVAPQQERFRRHIRAARKAGKPLIIHTREAAHDTMRIVAEEDAGQAGGVMHCFTENWEVARQALDLGFYISFSGIVTFKSASALREVARQVPADRLLIETDAPYLAPIPHRGQVNEPAYVRHVADCLAALRQVPLDLIAEQTTANFFSLFKSARPKAS